jgi:hypothetical protein
MQNEVISSGEELRSVDADILEALLDHPRVGVILPTRLNSFQMECQVSPGEYPSLDIQLLPLQLTTDQVNLSGECVLFCEKFQKVLIARAKIVENVSDKQIRVEIIETEKKEQEREFFRIDAEICLDHCRTKNGQLVGPGELQRVNLSGNGLRFATDLDLQENELLQIALDFPGSKVDSVKAIGRVVRLFNTRSDGQEVAVELFEVDESTQDRIVKFCISEQTRRVRMMVQLRD